MYRSGSTPPATAACRTRYRLHYGVHRLFGATIAGLQHLSHLKQICLVAGGHQAEVLIDKRPWEGFVTALESINGESGFDGGARSQTRVSPTFDPVDVVVTVRNSAITVAAVFAED